MIVVLLQYKLSEAGGRFTLHIIQPFNNINSAKTCHESKENEWNVENKCGAGAEKHDGFL